MAATFELYTRVEAAARRAQDHVSASIIDGGAVVVLADGAGGLSGGLDASQIIVSELREAGFATAEEWESRLRRLDGELFLHPKAGWSTAVALSIRGETITGASVGDSEAWLFREDLMIALTAGQRRKPLLGTGEARARGFTARLQSGERLLVASDGVLKYAAIADLWIDSLEAELEDASRRMIERVRLPSGSLRDDVSLALVRRRP